MPGFIMKFQSKLIFCIQIYFSLENIDWDILPRKFYGSFVFSIKFYPLRNGRRRINWDCIIYNQIFQTLNFDKFVVQFDRNIFWIDSFSKINGRTRNGIMAYDDVLFSYLMQPTS
jgi:hypothetical protein